MKFKKNNPVLIPIRGEYDEKLKPCPFCGQPARLNCIPDDVYAVECTNCLAQNEGETIGSDGEIIDHRAAMGDAVEVWNQRA